jgi:hypothetical protein
MLMGWDNDAVWMRWRPQEGTRLHLVTLDGSKVKTAWVVQLSSSRQCIEISSIVEAVTVEQATIELARSTWIATKLQPSLHRFVGFKIHDGAPVFSADIPESGQFIFIGAGSQKPFGLPILALTCGCQKC